MGDFLKDLGGNILFNITKGVEKRVDGREAGKAADLKIDDSLGERNSERVQRGPATNFVFEFIEGLWDEDLQSLVTRIQAWIDDLNNRLKKED